MKTLTLQRVARNLMKFTPPIILEESSTTRRCFYGEIASDDEGVWNLRGTIVAERKGKDGWHPQNGAELNRLKGGEIAKLELRTEHVKNFITGLQILADAAKMEGIDWRGAELVVGRKDEILHVDREQKAVIEDLINGDHAPEFWELLTSLQPNMAAQLADAELLRRRQASVVEFEQHLAARDWNEPLWEKFFFANQWIFGLGLRFQLLRLLQNQANYGGADYTRKGEQKGEFLMHTEAAERFTLLVEIKLPETSFFHNRPPYRNGVPGFNSELMNAVSQVQVNTHTWEMDGSKGESVVQKLAGEHIRTFSPRSILVFGHTDELDTYDKRKAFELFRCSLKAPEIVTFDELLARARFITRDAAAPSEAGKQA